MSDRVDATGITMTWGAALAALKHGQRVARAGWRDSGVYVFMVAGSQFEVSRPPLNQHFPPGTRIDYLPHIDIYLGGNTVSVWHPQMFEMMADDWVLVGVEVTASAPQPAGDVPVTDETGPGLEPVQIN